ncbi:MAG: anti-sigma factor antagonist [Bacillota bacterium]
MVKETYIYGDTILVKLLGELDLKVADDFRNQLETLLDNNPGKGMILDFYNVGFIDSSGLGVLLGRYKRLKTEGRNLSIIEVQPQVKRILELSGLVNLIPVNDITYQG